MQMLRDIYIWYNKFGINSDSEDQLQISRRDGRAIICVHLMRKKNWDIRDRVWRKLKDQNVNVANHPLLHETNTSSSIIPFVDSAVDSSENRSNSGYVIGYSQCSILVQTRLSALTKEIAGRTEPQAPKIRVFPFSHETFALDSHLFGVYRYELALSVSDMKELGSLPVHSIKSTILSPT